ncbi:hypothetical protein [Pleomorphovibrio marinus]|nr:hypothetical protein [Pleomorphovibrio marinus]
MKINPESAYCEEGLENLSYPTRRSNNLVSHLKPYGSFPNAAMLQQQIALIGIESVWRNSFLIGKGGKH